MLHIYLSMSKLLLQPAVDGFRVRLLNSAYSTWLN